MTTAVNQIAPPQKTDAGDAPASQTSVLPRVVRWAILSVILWLALFLRVWQLDTLPPGLHYDEAFNGVMARDVLRGVQRPIFFTANFGEEPLHMYVEAGVFALLGESPWSIRLTSAFFGVLFVAAVYACARAFFPRADLLALGAAFLAATLLWALMFARIGIETTTLPALLTLSAAALGFMYRRWTWRWVLGAGFLLGAMIYTYLASRLWPLAVLLWFLYLVAFHRAGVRAHFAKWLALALVALLTLAPLILFFIQNPLALTGRSGDVFTPATFGANLARTAGMFFFNGDLDPRDNLPGRAALDALLAIFFSVGIVISVVRFRKPFYAFLLIWLAVMSLPSALTEFAPNFRRAIGALPATILLCAVGVEWVCLKIRHLDFKIHKARYAAYLFVALALVTSAFWSARAYFVEWANNPGLYYSFDAGLLQLAKLLAARPRDEAIYFSPAYRDHYTALWAFDGRPVSAFDGRNLLLLADSSRAATYGIITHEDTQTVGQLGNFYAGSELPTVLLDAAGNSYATILTFPANTRKPIQPSRPLAVKVGDFATLAGFEVEPNHFARGDTVRVRLYWNVAQGAAEDYTAFVHLVGPHNPATNSSVWAQADKQPGDGTYPTTRWRRGETIIEDYVFKLPPEAAAGEYKIETGMYLLETGARVPLTENDARLTDDTVILKQFVLP